MSRSIGPDGCDARSSGTDRSKRSGGWPVSGMRAPGGVVVWLRGRTVPLRSRRAVIGRVGLSGGGPPRRSAPVGGRGGAAVPFADPDPLAPRRRPSIVSPARVSAAYAALISAIRRVARWALSGSSPVRSGWCCRARPRQAALMSSGLAPGSTPSTAWGSLAGTTRVYLHARGPQMARPRLTGSGQARSSVRMARRRLQRTRKAGIAAALAALPFALAYRFALVYRVRAGYPHRHPPVWTPDTVGLAFEDVEIPSSDGLRLPGWYLPAGPGPAAGRRPGPRLGVGARPDDPPRAGPARGRGSTS